MKQTIPAFIARYFWGDNLKELSWERHKDYITKTLLEKGDRRALVWLFKRANKVQLKAFSEQNKLDPKSRNFWQLYLS